MKTNTKVVVTTIGLGLLTAVASLALRPPDSWSDTSFAFHYPLATDGLMAILHIGAALLFFMSLSVYKAKLRLAFTGIAIGILLIGLGTVQLPILDAYDLWETFYVTSGIIALPFLISGLALYFGASSFGRLVGEKGLITRRGIILAAALVASALSTILPHPALVSASSEMEYDLNNALFVWILFLDLATAIIFLQVRKRIGSHYRMATTWLSLAILSSVTCLVLALLDAYTATSVRTNFTLALNTMVVIAGFAWLKAGYIFTRTKEY
jgi:hypothetical protein